MLIMRIKTFRKLYVVMNVIFVYTLEGGLVITDVVWIGQDFIRVVG